MCSTGRLHQIFGLKGLKARQYGTENMLRYSVNHRNKVCHAVTQLVEALRYKSEGRGFDSVWCHWNFFIDIILPAALWP